MATYAAKLRQEGVDGSTVRLDADGKVSSNLGMQPFTTKGGQVGVFYVDGNIVSSGDGKTWQTAKKTLAEGLAQAHAFQSTDANRAWSYRSKLYVSGDDLDEDLTKFAEKTDVIGVGSDDGRKGPALLGNHVLEAASSDTYAGCRFINMTFTPEAAGPVITIPAGQHGIEFQGCKFEWAASSTTGILVTASSDTIVNGCKFIKGSSTGFTTGAIVFAAGAAGQTQITDNYIDAAIGVVINASTTGEGFLVQDNTFVVATLAFDDNADIGYLVNNMIISAADNDTIGNIIDGDDALMVGNIVTGSSSTQTHPFAAIS
jgi:hypothetical protein